MINTIIKAIVTAVLNFFKKIFTEWLKIRKEEQEIENIEKKFKVDSKPDDAFDDKRFNKR